MAFGSTTQYNLLNLVLGGKPISNLAATAGSSVVWCALHTADPSGGTAGTNETTWAAYTRVSVDRSTGATGWTWSTAVSSAYCSFSPQAAITFPQQTTAGTQTLTHWSVVVTSATTAGVLLAAGAISPNITMNQNVTPQITTGSSISLT